ncbi:MAG: serine/threonine protein kinase [Alphaproteobacteria bacterium]|jgi:HPr kinase/phosphorylase|nr:serine/threonine protein kinase [Alphaproteobacteria bacterium]MBT4964626.1 serine/threonine protein kinase [Alphaproteobacteria bacterium]MBT5159295.1 serine/threonine protein kinase [Alphaproteobacteria bacterium]MBT5918512.1 serine/threonine protein kinase [Alphaproteobacteria bacterium]MBT6386588.1 serine/threonine protein kinase [Alphaproteobacteria bacterium]
MTLVHGTCIAFPLVEEAGVAAAVLLRGLSGIGKSDLALRLIDDGAQLVADDQVDLELTEEGLLASAPQTIRGMLEVRGVGLVHLPVASKAALVAIIDLVGVDTEIERLPEPDEVDIAGTTLPLWKLQPFESSAMAKVGVIVAVAAGRASIEI